MPTIELPPAPALAGHFPELPRTPSPIGCDVPKRHLLFGTGLRETSTDRVTNKSRRYWTTRGAQGV